MAKKWAELISAMVEHFYTVMRLQQKAPHNGVWLEDDVQFRMEAAVSEDKSWPSDDSWQYVSCLPEETWPGII